MSDTVKRAFNEMMAARKELASAEQNFDYVKSEYFEVANRQLNAAKEKYFAAATKYKIASVENAAMV